MSPDDSPNPNVMYELGIRHAFGLPAVIFIQNPDMLPFDVTPQRAIVEPRTFETIDRVRLKLTDFITAAANGTYYQPMNAVRRAERLSVEATGENQFLKDMVSEMRDMKRLLQEQQPLMGTGRSYPRGTIGELLGTLQTTGPSGPSVKIESSEALKALQDLVDMAKPVSTADPIK